MEKALKALPKQSYEDIMHRYTDTFSDFVDENAN